MAKFEYRSERLDGAGGCEVAAVLNRWGAEGWQVFQIEPAGGGHQVWLRRELPVALAGLRSARA